MDSDVELALLKIGQSIAELVRMRMAIQGHGGNVDVLIADNRVIVSSRAANLRVAEVGCPGRPPAAVFVATARDVLPNVATDLWHSVVRQA